MISLDICLHVAHLGCLHLVIVASVILMSSVIILSKLGWRLLCETIFWSSFFIGIENWYPRSYIYWFMGILYRNRRDDVRKFTLSWRWHCLRMCFDWAFCLAHLKLLWMSFIGYFLYGKTISPNYFSRVSWSLTTGTILDTRLNGWFILACYKYPK